MSEKRPRYSPEQVQAILEMALQRRSDAPDGITHDELLDTARELDINENDLHAAIRDYEESWELEDAKERWKERRKQKFFDHLRSYLIVNSVLAVLAITFSWGGIFLWTLIGWGIGLAFDAMEAFRPKERDVLRGAERLLNKERKERKKQERQEYWSNLADGFKKQFRVDHKSGKIVIEKGDRRIEIG